MLNWFSIYQSSKFPFCLHRFQLKLTQTLTKFDLHFIHPYKILVSFQMFPRSKCLDNYLELSQQCWTEFLFKFDTAWQNFVREIYRSLCKFNLGVLYSTVSTMQTSATVSDNIGAVEIRRPILCKETERFSDLVEE